MIMIGCILELGVSVDGTLERDCVAGILVGIFAQTIQDRFRIRRIHGVHAKACCSLKGGKNDDVFSKNDDVSQCRARENVKCSEVKCTEGKLFLGR